MNPIKELIYQKAIPIYGKLNKNNNRFVQMIYYHDIVTGKGHSFMQINRDKFFAQMKYIKDNGYKTLLFEDLNTDPSFREKTVMIAFDDGWVSNYTEIFDFMKENGIRYNIFLAAGSIGTDKDYLTPQMIKEMKESGIVSFGAHTYDHVTLENISEIDKERQFYEANRKIAEWTGTAPLDLCFPKGIYTEESLDYMIKNAPYNRLWTSLMQYSESIDGKIVFGRAAISGDEPFSVFVNKLNGYYNCFSNLKGKKGF